jgi:ArsR family transcriptional regulator
MRYNSLMGKLDKASKKMTAKKAAAGGKKSGDARLASSAQAAEKQTAALLEGGGSNGAPMTEATVEAALEQKGATPLAMDDERRAKVFAALSDPTRVRLADLLACRSERSGTELAGELNISLALFCHHSGKMAEAGLIARRKEGQTTFYALNRDALSQSVAPLLCSTDQAMDSSDQDAAT